MSSFLEKTSKHLLTTYGSNLPEVCIVMPNRRAGLFLNRFLAAELTKPTWAPMIYSIEDFMVALAELREIEPVHLLVDLYTIYRESAGMKAKPFDEFLNWGPQLLADFNEIDRYMANPQELFGYLNEVRAINLWNLDKTPLTEFQKNYLAFYNSLGEYYLKLTERLTGRGEGYQGLVFRHAVERVEAGLAEIPWKHIVFVGFNALTTAEERVMASLRQSGRAEFLWDADRYYLDQTHQEAGSFLRQWFSKWPLKEKNWISEDFLNGEKNIEIIGVPDVTGQVKFCGEILKQFGDALDDHTAVVLPDEKLLMPLLNSLPSEVSEINVTMGLPLGISPLADLLEIVFQMHLRAAGMQGGNKTGKNFYFRDVLKILQHPLVYGIASRLLEGNQFVLTDLTTRIRSGSRVFLRKEDIHGKGLFDAGCDFLDPFFEPWRNPGDAISSLRTIVRLINASDEPETEQAYAFSRILHQLNEIVAMHADYFSLHTLYQFYRHLTESSSLPFYGEPLKGTQVMGMLETRTLDFENLIILSCNEGLLPSAKEAHSFIPFDIKHEFGLPTYHQKDAVYAYHFYRLLQRSKRVWLIYGCEPDQLGGGEKSRFLQQINLELPLYNPGISIRESLLSSAIPKKKEQPPIIIEKSGEVFERMMKKASDGLAPTALNAFRNCSLRFYFSEIARLREPEDISDTIDPKTLGIAVHHALYQLFLPYRDALLTLSIVKEMINKTDNEIQLAFTEKFPGTAVSLGKNLLLVNVASLLIKNFLKEEMDLITGLEEKGLQLRIVLLEQHFRRQLKIILNERELEVTVKGVVDRIDRVGDELRVIDYKTGLSEKRELAVTDWNDLLNDSKLDKGFQLLTYAWLWGDRSGNSPLRAGIISLRSLSSGLMTVSVPGENEVQDKNPAKKYRGEMDKNDKIGRPELDAFETILKELIADIFDTDAPFTQTKETERCESCTYKTICGR